MNPHKLNADEIYKNLGNLSATNEEFVAKMLLLSENLEHLKAAIDIDLSKTFAGIQAGKSVAESSDLCTDIGVSLLNRGVQCINDEIKELLDCMDRLNNEKPQSGQNVRIDINIKNP